jgi:hypothetical protein
MEPSLWTTSPKATQSVSLPPTKTLSIVGGSKPQRSSCHLYNIPGKQSRGGWMKRMPAQGGRWQFVTARRASFLADANSNR